MISYLGDYVWTPTGELAVVVGIDRDKDVVTVRLPSGNKYSYQDELLVTEYEPASYPAFKVFKKERDEAMHNPRNYQPFRVGHIVQVRRMYSGGSTGEIVYEEARVEYVERGDDVRLVSVYDISFPDGENGTYNAHDLRLPTDDELYAYLYGHTPTFVQSKIMQQLTKLTMQDFASGLSPYYEFFVGQAVSHTEYGYGVIIRIDPYSDTYTMSLGVRSREYVNTLGEPVDCSAYELRLMNYGEIEAYGKAVGMSEAAIQALKHMQQFKGFKD